MVAKAVVTAPGVMKHPEQVLFCILSLTDSRNRVYFAPQSLTDASFVLPVIASNAAVVTAALC